MRDAVVNCFKISIFVLSNTTMKPRNKFEKGCELL